MKNLRKAESSDIKLIQELAEKSWNAAYKGIISQEQINFMLNQMYSEAEITNQLNNPNYHYFIILNDEDVPVGFIGFENHYEPGTTKLHRIYLIPEAKGQGLGKLALNFLKDEVSKTSDRRIILNVNKINNARQIYEVQGFTVYDEVVLQIGNGYVMDDYLMEYRI